MNQLDIINVYRILCPTTAKCTLLPSQHTTLTKIDYILCHKTSLNKFEKIQCKLKQ